MPAYFYHLKLELYSHPLPSADSWRSHKSSSAYLPSPGTDIFTSNLPVHRQSRWTPDSLSKKHLRQSSSDSNSERSPSRPGSAGAGVSEGHGSALLLPERNLALKEPASPVLPPAKPSSDIATKDWRFGPVSVDCIEMENKEKSHTPAKGPGGLYMRGQYIPSDISTTDVGWGVVHLYRDSQETPALDDGYEKRVSDRAEDVKTQMNADNCTTLCILAVPSWMMPSDLLGFVGDQTREDVSHFRLIRTGRANKYMVLIKFRQAKKAREWQKVYNGRLFSAMEVYYLQPNLLNRP